LSTERKPAGRDWRLAVREAAPYMALGTTLAVDVGLGVGVGYWADRRYGTSPLFLLVGAGLGMALAGLYLYKTLAGRGK
jgi:F0F1-type ATP synthase assembly protein I